MDEAKIQERLDPGVEGAIWVPNVLLLLTFALYVLISNLAPNRIQALVMTDSKTTQRIWEIERQLAIAPNKSDLVVELARLYAKAGELPLSYDALRDVEQNGSRDPRFKMRLAMAYLELGKNADGQRVMKSALEACDLRRCPPAVRARLSIFAQVADIYVERNIDTRKKPHLAKKVFDEVVREMEKGTMEMIMKAAKRAAKGAASRPSSKESTSRKR